MWRVGHGGALLLVLLGLLLNLPSPTTALFTPRRLSLGNRLQSIQRKPQLSSFRAEDALEKILAARGGGDDEDEDEEDDGEDFDEEEEEEEEERQQQQQKKTTARRGSLASLEEDQEEDEDDELNEDGDVNDGDFNDGAMFNVLKKEYARTPPITKGYLWGSVGITMASYLLNGGSWPQWLLLEWKPVLTKLQIWRPFTSFLYLGNLGLNYVLSAHFMWTYMAHLEKLKCKDPAEFLVMLLFGATSLLVASQVIGFPPVYLGHNLSCYLVYIWSRMFEGQDVDVMGLFHLPAHLLPWFFVAQTLVLEQELPVSDLVGIAVGHVYHFLHSSKRLRPPEALRSIFARKEIRKLYRKFEDELQEGHGRISRKADSSPNGPQTKHID